MIGGMALEHLSNEKTVNHLWKLNRQIQQDKLDEAIKRVLQNIKHTKT